MIGGCGGNRESVDDGSESFARDFGIPAPSPVSRCPVLRNPLYSNIRADKRNSRNPAAGSRIMMRIAE
jgi:hypothetical protein